MTPEGKGQVHKCEFCDSVFEAPASLRNCTRKYCSKKCSEEAQKRGTTRTCPNCGVSFHQREGAAVYGKEVYCCSWACGVEYYRGPNARTWAGGRYVVAGRGTVMVYLKRPGYAGAYIGEHRLVASKAVGRLLDKGEDVIHLNNNKADNQESNLFICGSHSEAAKRFNGTLPWPTESNLSTYK